MTQVKFNRNYLLSITFENGDKLVIQPPFTIEFDIVRNTLSASNTAHLRIYNLSAINRNLLRFDYSNFSTIINVVLYAGYGNNLPLVFSGNITQAWSIRENNNFITTIECFDGGFAFINGIIPSTITFPKGTSLETVYKTLMSYLPGTTFGAIGPSFIRDKSGNPFLTTRSNSYKGNTAAVLNELSGNAFFIDNNRSYILSNTECLLGQVNLINAASGLLNTPLREKNTVSFEMEFEPGIIVGQYIQLDTLTNPVLNSDTAFTNGNTDNVNGFYQIVSIKHRGLISPAVCGEAITALEFFLGPQALTTVSTQ